MRRLPARGPFKDPTVCDACENTRASSHYCEPHARRPRCPNMGGDDDAHIHRRCARCQYEWVETPLNKES